MRRAAVLMLLFGGSFGVGGALASIEAHVIATDPTGAVVALGVNQVMNVRIGYASSSPIRIWARPYRNGKEVSAMSNPSVLHQGSGEALGWFSFGAPAQVDEVRILAGDGSRRGTQVVASLPIQVTVGGAGPTPGAQPDWVNELQAQDRAVTREAYAKAASSRPSTAESVLMGSFMLATLALLAGGVAAPAWGLWKWRGGWRMAAVVPLALVAFVVLRIVVDTSRDPTSHNLWPFEILMWGAVSALIMVGLWVVRRFAGVSR